MKIVYKWLGIRFRESGTKTVIMEIFQFHSFKYYLKGMPSI
ncbi:hypothetical protein [Nonlabens dokdonensis]|nr:hypothetical protein [Nonlabens dokdonensis]